MKLHLARATAALRSLSKEKKRAAAAALCVTAAQAGLLFLLNGNATSANGAEAFVSVVVAKHNLPPGELFKAEDFELKQIPAASLLRQVVRLEDVEELRGLPLRSPIPAGLPINLFAIAPLNEKQFDPSKVPTGKRLHVVDVQLGRLASVVRPGDRVDLLANIPVPDVGMITEALLEGAEVVAAAGTSTGTSALSFHLSPDEVKAMVHASQFARFTVSLRNPNDLGTRNTSPAMTLARLLEDPRLRKSLGGALWSMPSTDSPKAEESGSASLKGNSK